VILFLLVKQLGLFMAKVDQGEHTFLDRVLPPIKRFVHRLSGIKPNMESVLENKLESVEKLKHTPTFRDFYRQI